MPKKNKYNPSKHPVLTKGMRSQKGAFLKFIDRQNKRLDLFKKK